MEQNKPIVSKKYLYGKNTPLVFTAQILCVNCLEAHKNEKRGILCGNVAICFPFMP